MDVECPHVWAFVKATLNRCGATLVHRCVLCDGMVVETAVAERREAVRILTRRNA